MAGAITDKLGRMTDSTTARPIVASLSAPGHTTGGTTITISAATNWTTTTKVYIAIYTTKTVGSSTVKDTTTQTDWTGTLSGTTINNLVLTGGTDRDYAAGAIVELTATSAYYKDLYDWGITHANQDGSLKASAVQTALGLGAGSLNGWNALGYTPNSVTCNGNRSYDLVFNGTDLTGTLSPGMRLMTTRTVAAPTRSTSLNGTSQYYSKTSPAGMTFTGDFAAGAHIKPSAYQLSGIISRITAAAGWGLYLNASGCVGVQYGTGSNIRYIESYQSVALNKWSHVAVVPSISGGTASIYLDGVLIPSRSVAGTATTMTQAGNLEVGSYTGANFFPGKIAQAFVTSATMTQANVRTLISQGLTSSLISTNNIISAYSFDNSINDLNTTNANNLTANGGAVATNADSPFGTQASGSNSSTLDYAEVTDISFSTNTTATVRALEGNTIPTSGGVSAVSYSTQFSPYGWPGGTTVLGRALRMSDATTTSTTGQQVDGLTITVIPPVNREIRIVAYCPNLTYSGGNGLLQLWDGTVGSGTLLEAFVAPSVSNSGANIIWQGKPSSGAHTYNVGIRSTASATLTATGTPTNPMMLQAEVVL